MSEGRGGQHFLFHDGMGFGFLGRQPHRAAPNALCAKRHGGCHLATAADATGAEHRRVADRFDDLGDQHHRRDLTGVSAGLVALGDNHVDACVHVPFGVLSLAGQRPGAHTLGAAALDHDLRWWTERVHHDRWFERQRDLEVWHLGVGRHGRGGIFVQVEATAAGLIEGWYAIPIEHLVEKLAVRGRDHLLDRADRQATLVGAGVLGGNDQVDAIRLAADLFFDPGKIDLELAGRQPHRTEHAESARLGHRGDDVAQQCVKAKIGTSIPNMSVI